MSDKNPRLPKYRLHKARGMGVVTLGGRDIYLGKYRSPESKALFEKLVAAWLERGRVHLDKAVVAEQRTIVEDAVPRETTVADVLNDFRKSGKIKATKADAYKAVMRIIVRLYGSEAAKTFGPKALQVVRSHMEAAGWKRETINQRMHNVRRIFRWAVSQEMIEPDQLAKLNTLEALRQGDTTAPESVAVQPVALEHVEACIPYMPPTVAAMVRLQMLTGMRAGELCQLRSIDVDQSQPDAWIYRPKSHKTKHLGKSRAIVLGPKAVKVLRPMLLQDLSAFVFSPVRADAERRATRAAQRKTPLHQGNKAGENRQSAPQRTPGDRYDTPAYRRAIEYATAQAFRPPPELERMRGEITAAWKERLGDRWADLIAHRKAHHWHPHQLRHTFATLVRGAFDLEHATATLGHSSSEVTKRYAKLSLDKAIDVAKAVG